MRKILVHRTHKWSETISGLLNHQNCRIESAVLKWESMCNSSWHTILLSYTRASHFVTSLGIEPCHEKHRWPLPNLLWEPHHHWWPLPRWNGSLLWELHWMVTSPQFMLDGLQLISEPPFPSGFEAKLFWFQVKLLNWVPFCCSFQHLFVVYTMNWNPPCIVSKILGTTFMQSSLCVTQQDERYYSCVTRSSKNGSNNHWLRFLTVSRQILLLWMSLNC